MKQDALLISHEEKPARGEAVRGLVIVAEYLARQGDKRPLVAIFADFYLRAPVAWERAELRAALEEYHAAERAISPHIEAKQALYLDL